MAEQLAAWQRKAAQAARQAKAAKAVEAQRALRRREGEEAQVLASAQGRAATERRQAQHRENQGRWSTGFHMRAALISPRHAHRDRLHIS